MLKYLHHTFSSVTLYIQIKPDLLHISHIPTGKQIIDRPVLAIDKEENIIAIGKAAEDLHKNQSVSLLNGFDHPRSILHDFEIAEKTLLYYFNQLMPDNLFKTKPIIVMHPLERLIGGLTQVEAHALKKLALSVGASKAYIWCGRTLTDLELGSGQLPKKGWIGDTPLPQIKIKKPLKK